MYNCMLSIQQWISGNLLVNLVNTVSFLFVISYEPTIPYSVALLTLLMVLVSYLSMLYLPVIFSLLLFPLLNSYILTPSITEYLYTSLLFFIFLEVMLFLAYFWWYFHNYSYIIGSLSQVSPVIFSSSTYYLIAGLILSLLSIYLSLTPLLVFIVLSFCEFSSVLDMVSINDSAFISLQLTVVSLHLLHLIVGMLFILCEVSYPHYYHFIEVIWLLIGYCIYLQAVLTSLSHLRYYLVSMNLNYFYNFGFLLGVSIFLQTITGLLLTLIYYSSLQLYTNIYTFSFDFYYGYFYRYLHIVFATIINALLLIHIFKGLLYSNLQSQVYTHYSGFILYLLIVVISYLGYILTYGQLSFWGATVIINLLPVPLQTLILGSYSISSVTINRYLIFHMLLTFLLYFFIVIHIFYLHSMSSQSPVPTSINRTSASQLHISFFFFIFKDITSTILLLVISFSICLFTMLTLSHPINMIPINPLVTPSHIVPEWYFLYLYTLLKIIPNKLGGILSIVVALLFILLLSTSLTSSTLSSITLLPSTTFLIVYYFSSYFASKFYF